MAKPPAAGDTKKTGTDKPSGQSNKLGYGGRAAQLERKGVPSGVIGAIARSKGAAPGGPNYHGGKGGGMPPQFAKFVKGKKGEAAPDKEDAADAARDKKAGIKEDSARDERIDAKLGKGKGGGGVPIKPASNALPKASPSAVAGGTRHLPSLSGFGGGGGVYHSQTSGAASTLAKSRYSGNGK